MSTNLVISSLAANLWTDADVDSTLETIKSGSTVIYAIEVDNESNTVSTYLKLYNSTTAVVGTTAPDLVLEVPAGEKLTLAFPQGLTFATGLQAAAVTVGGTTGATSPANAAVLELAYT